MMQAPTRLDLTSEQLEELIDRLNRETLAQTDYPLLANLLRAMSWLNFSLQEKQLSIRRLRAIFGIKTETAKKLAAFAAGKSASNALQDIADNAGEDALETSSSNSSEPANSEKRDNKKGKHGHRPASDYTQAKTIDIAHETLKKGSSCPACLKGRLFNLSSGTVLRIIGQPWLQFEIYSPERLRCSACGQLFTATLPQNVMIGSRADSSAKAIVSLLKYRGGVPFYRQQQIQGVLGAPISASEIWEMTEDVADALLPVYAVTCELASNAELIHNDDTKARILSVIEERKSREGTENEDERQGIFTTGILAELKKLGVKIGLYFTGRKHAGENLEELLDDRASHLQAPIQHCDGGHNVPKNHTTQVSNCLAHSRRKFYELVEVWPTVVMKIIGWFASIFAHDKSAPLDPDERLKWHQEKSGPIVQQIKEYCEGLLERREVEPNSSLGKAIAYFNNQFEGLTLFLKVPGVPLTNNICERLLKKAVLNRKNAYFYRNETGAKIGDILMSMMETCVLNDKNPWDYLVAIQEHQKDVRKNPALWVPWNFEARIKELLSPG